MTALYFVARYCGSASQLATLAATLPLDWTATMYASIHLILLVRICSNFYSPHSADRYITIAAQGLSFMFVAAMQVILLLRAYALCNRSRKVFVILLVSFVCEMIAVVVVKGKSLHFFDIATSTGWADGVLGAYSVYSYPLDLWQTVSKAIQLAFDILLLAVALFGSVKHALETKRFTKGWSINPLVKVLAEDQIAYFVWYAAWQGTDLSAIIINSAGVGTSALDGLHSLFGAFAIIAGPRMVISLRAQELKTREGTLQTQLSTIRFHARGSSSQLDAEEELV
ncbi:hypothetical protein BV22DRAFT_1135075 [Leucogyrophana mollusca]|uniref:Uncharacterized protein n=1 Tax=Leucogyrophana mollusca TaxID=85980 RepID=A0ACB8AXZ3_9AGAM|nr:hypothetical protein BV22DRAFT_1135075 [Leucogyrophana mollusca]